MNIVQIYAPTNEAHDKEKDAFYDLLQEVMDKLPKKDINILMGDANAKIGRENTGYDRIMGSHGLGEMNDNGERFANFCLFNKMVIGGPIFPHKRVHKATWVSSDNVTENQIDHFCVSQRFRRSLNDVIVQRGADIGSDHHYVAWKTEATPQEARKSKGSAKETILSKSPEWCYKGRFQTVLEE
ncbi:craniofacial development protein 2 [Elysia marginata]|uniref:Craniofacial development protein 2 n=1 Tax=Elysia marginata TaxID=1093978 RepID=A0AAV4FBT4_9GAST|nr:craniofacial development protein 2 [Elysia marginata]